MRTRMTIALSAAVGSALAIAICVSVYPQVESKKEAAICPSATDLLQVTAWLERPRLASTPNPVFVGSSDAEISGLLKWKVYYA